MRRDHRDPPIPYPFRRVEPRVVKLVGTKSAMIAATGQWTQLLPYVSRSRSILLHLSAAGFGPDVSRQSALAIVVPFLLMVDAAVGTQLAMKVM